MLDIEVIFSSLSLTLLAKSKFKLFPLCVCEDEEEEKDPSFFWEVPVSAGFVEVEGCREAVLAKEECDVVVPGTEAGAEEVTVVVTVVVRFRSHCEILPTAPPLEASFVTNSSTEGKGENPIGKLCRLEASVSVETVVCKSEFVSLLLTLFVTEEDMGLLTLGSDNILEKDIIAKELLGE